MIDKLKKGRKYFTKSISLNEEQLRKIKIWEVHGYNPSAVLRKLIDEAPENWEQF